ncbi:flagella synthesis protein FlgN [Microbulbifer sp. HZ11]|uniref:flagella synthesis protein FlgN n=1 Tax=unclassified Microbulbifer TaxID=2619833 RepID=UPI0005BE9B39|nr:flagellar protein FlgN [Microbulbifer sp. HZ11]
MSLHQFLQQHRQRVEHLTQLLYDERTELSAGTVDGGRLTDIARRKQESLHQLNDLEQQRRTALQRLGYTNDRQGDEQAAREAGCLPLWQDLIALAGEAERLNRANGTVINIRAESNQRLLNALQEAKGKGLYGPDGRARVPNGKIDSRA